ncbi:DUF3253 domain-containing protein [Algoriphagus resistens]|uniref:DUF3253 domain-containing protein n=1 Tax=Algoriphagus resistens TaxID=1750590 RepID=UPI0007167EBF|nr:DUF3253 domain-containing protein [Algoriphagus resistens]
MEVLRTAILDMLKRKKGGILTSSEVAQRMFPEDWEQFLEDVNRETMELYREGLISIGRDDQQEGFNTSKASLQILPPGKL